LRKGATPRSGETTRKNHAKGFIRLKQLLGNFSFTYKHLYDFLYQL
jgi:hypothetical protein